MRGPSEEVVLNLLPGRVVDPAPLPEGHSLGCVIHLFPPTIGLHDLLDRREGLSVLPKLRRKARQDSCATKLQLENSPRELGVKPDILHQLHSVSGARRPLPGSPLVG